MVMVVLEYSVEIGGGGFDGTSFVFMVMFMQSEKGPIPALLIAATQTVSCDPGAKLLRFVVAPEEV